jgi:hypothetical protein
MQLFALFQMAFTQTATHNLRLQKNCFFLKLIEMARPLSVLSAHYTVVILLHQNQKTNNYENKRIFFAYASYHGLRDDDRTGEQNHRKKTHCNNQRRHKGFDGRQRNHAQYGAA